MKDASEGSLEIPLFTLHTVLLPGGILPLRIFEPRYVDMVSACMKSDSEFGVVLISEGEEVGRAASSRMVGTLARITDWQQGSDGLLNITCLGGERFRVLSSAVNADQLTTASVELLPSYSVVPVPEEYNYLQGALPRLQKLLGYPSDEMRDDAAWLGSRLVEIMPITLDRKQQILQMNDSVDRLARVAAELDALSRAAGRASH